MRGLTENYTEGINRVNKLVSLGTTIAELDEQIAQLPENSSDRSELQERRRLLAAQQRTTLLELYEQNGIR